MFSSEAPNRAEITKTIFLQTRGLDLVGLMPASVAESGKILKLLCVNVLCQPGAHLSTSYYKGEGPGAAVKAACLKSRRLRVRTPL